MSQWLKPLAMFFYSIYIQSYLNIAQGFNLGDIMYSFQYSSPGFIFTKHFQRFQSWEMTEKICFTISVFIYDIFFALNKKSKKKLVNN